MAKRNKIKYPKRKHCNRCDKTKPANQFGKWKTGLSTYCKPCEKKRHGEWDFQQRVKKYGYEEAVRRANKYVRLKEPVRAEHKICSNCLLEKPYAAFWAGNNNRDAYRPACMECMLSKVKVKRNSSPENVFKALIQSTRHTVRRKAGRGIIIQHELTVPMLLDLWESQKGLCFYTGRKMVHDGQGTTYSVSVDRINSNIGYVRNNIVLCCVIVNVMKNSLSTSVFVDWCQAIAEFRPINDNTHVSSLSENRTNNVKTSFDSSKQKERWRGNQYMR